MLDTAVEGPSLDMNTPPQSTLHSVRVSDDPPPADTCQVGILCMTSTP